MKLSLAIIAKDQVSECAGIINKYYEIFDEIIIVGDDKHEEFGALTGAYAGDEFTCIVKYYNYKWISDFADKRNFAASKVTSEYYVRIDTDDSIIGAEHIRSVAQRASENKIDVVFTKYLYMFDKDGNVQSEHWRETIIRKHKDVFWKGRVHESVLFTEKESARVVKDNSIVIKHNIDQAHIDEAYQRNLLILLKEYNEDQQNADPRVISYIGRSFLGVGKYAEAVSFLEIFVAKSGWIEDVYFGYCQLAEAYLRLGETKKAIDSAFKAITLYPEYPDAYLKLGQIYLDQQNFKTALHWYEIGIMKPIADTIIPLDPSHYGWIAQLNIALCHLGLGDAEKAFTFYSMASKSSPSADGVVHLKDLFSKALIDNKFFLHLISLCKMIEVMDKRKLKNVVDIIPASMMTDERASSIRNRYTPPVVRPPKSVAIYCGSSLEDWADPSVMTGIGGSEEAVVYMSRELVKLGYSVNVYNQCGDLAGEWNGVNYIPFYEFNNNDTFDTLIMWRGVLKGCKARRRFVWLHDVPYGILTEHNKDDYDKVFVLSEFHKSLLPACVDKDRIIVTRNGINLEDVSNVERQPKRCIYTSSYDRGLENLLNIWADVRKEVPDAELHIFYGWKSYDKLMAMGNRQPELKERICKKMEQDGVFDHGRVGHEELALEFAKSDYYVYPSHFPEISCISAMKAQAYGAIPITTDFSALKETIKYGFKVSGAGNEVCAEYKEKLIDCLKNDYSSMRKVLIDNNNQWLWTKVADEWHTIFQS